MIKKVRSGVCVQTKLYDPDSLIRVADRLMSTSYWALADVNVGDEVAVFDLGQDSGDTAIATGDVVYVHKHKAGRVTIVFTVTEDLIYRKDVLPFRNSHYYDILEDGKRQPRRKGG